MTSLEHPRCATGSALTCIQRQPLHRVAYMVSNSLHLADGLCGAATRRRARATPARTPRAARTPPSPQPRRRRTMPQCARGRAPQARRCQIYTTNGLRRHRRGRLAGAYAMAATRPRSSAGPANLIVTSVALVTITVVVDSVVALCCRLARTQLAMECVPLATGMGHQCCVRSLCSMQTLERARVCSLPASCSVPAVL